MVTSPVYDIVSVCVVRVEEASDAVSRDAFVLSSEETWSFVKALVVVAEGLSLFTEGQAKTRLNENPYQVAD